MAALLDMVLDIRGLTVRRDAVIAVENVGFSLESETATALVGPNGAGKSTQVQAIMGSFPPSAGSIGVTPAMEEKVVGKGSQ